MNESKTMQISAEAAIEMWHASLEKLSEFAPRLTR